MKKRAKNLLGKVKDTVEDLRDQVVEQATDASELLDTDVLKGGIAVIKDKFEGGLRATPLNKFMPKPSANQLEARRQAEGGYQRAEGHVSPHFGEPAGDHSSLRAVASEAMTERDPTREAVEESSSAATTRVKSKAASDSAGIAVRATIGKVGKDRVAGKAGSKKASSKKAAPAAKAAPAKKAAVKKTVAKKAAAKKVATKKVAVKKKAAAKKVVAKKVVAKKAAVKKTSARKPAAPRKPAK